MYNVVCFLSNKREIVYFLSLFLAEQILIFIFVIKKITSVLFILQFVINMPNFLLRLLAVLLIFNYSLVSSAQNTDSIYQILDEEIAHADRYIQIKEQRIAGREADLKRVKTDEAMFELSFSLYDEYSSYNDEKAKALLRQCLRIAEKKGDSNRKSKICAYLAYQNSMSGYYTEALHWLSLVDERAADRSTLADYYFAAAHIYGELGSYSKDKELSNLYFKTSATFGEKFFAVADTSTSFYYQRRLPYLINRGDTIEAERLCRKWASEIDKDSHDYAIMAYFMSECYRKCNQKIRCYWLAVSAICDCKNAVMNQASLWNLADIMSKSGSSARSRRYVEYSWMCTTKFGGHTRSWQVSPVITTINKNYRDVLSRKNRNLSILLISVSVLAVLFLASLLFLYKRNQQLSAARNELRKSNTQLAALISQLHESNGKMSQVNKELHDSNRVKDEYIARFLSLCSEYIDKLDAYRLKVNRRLKANQYKELLHMTSSNALLEGETKELFANFDAVFLKLYPNFAENFNSLMREEFRQQLGDNNELTTDMRIAALIRLGIDDSAHIAEFLRLSPNTIYNYRARLKSRACYDRDDFEKMIKAIGL